MKFVYSFRIPLISDYFIQPPTEMQKLEIKKKNINGTLFK